MPYRPHDTAFDTDDMAPRAAATPQEMFCALTAQGVPRQQAMVAAYARDNDVVQATLQAYGRPTVIPNAPLPSLTEIPIVDTRLPPADVSRVQVVQPMSAPGASVFPDPPQFPPQTIEDTMRRRPGFIPRSDGGEDLGPGYLDPRSETQRRSRWAGRGSSRESLGLPQNPTGQFAGVSLTGDASGGYGLDPHYAAQARRALDTELYVPSQRERIVRGGKFYAGAAPFEFAGPGSLSFDRSLESNAETLAPFRRPLAERGPLDIAINTLVERAKRAKEASLQPEPADHGYSERQKQSAVQRLLGPITNYPETYLRMNREAQEQVGRGVRQLENPDGPLTLAKGAGNIVFGGANYVNSPINAAVRTALSQPLEDLTGISRYYPEAMFQGGLLARRAYQLARYVGQKLSQ